MKIARPWRLLLTRSHLIKAAALELISLQSSLLRCTASPNVGKNFFIKQRFSACLHAIKTQQTNTQHKITFCFFRGGYVRDSVTSLHHYRCTHIRCGNLRMNFACRMKICYVIVLRARRRRRKKIWGRSLKKLYNYWLRRMERRRKHSDSKCERWNHQKLSFRIRICGFHFHSMACVTYIRHVRHYSYAILILHVPMTEKITTKTGYLSRQMNGIKSHRVECWIESFRSKHCIIWRDENCAASKCAVILSELTSNELFRFIL